MVEGKEIGVWGCSERYKQAWVLVEGIGSLGLCREKRRYRQSLKPAARLSRAREDEQG